MDAKDCRSCSENKSYIQPIPCKNKEVYTELNTLIYEYLEVNGLEQALQTFSKECQTKNLPCPKQGGSRDVKAAFTHYDGELMLKSFDDGDLETFLKLWKLFQTHIQVTSEDMRKLEVYLRVHFAIWPKAHKETEAKQNQAMQSLKTFFEEHSASLSSDATILPLFALPFVPDPRPHPIFKDLFHESWTIKLRAQLETTVNKYFELLQENITSHCKLASVIDRNIKNHNSSSAAKPITGILVNKSNSPGRRTSSLSRSISTGSSSQQIKGKNADSVMSVLKQSESAIVYHQDRFFQLLGIHRKSRKLMGGIRENYGKLLKVCSELVSALEKTMVDKDQDVRLDVVLQQCFLTFPEMFTNPDSSGSKPDLVHFKKIAAAPFEQKPQDSDVSLMFLGIVDIGPETLNYDKVKGTLMSDKIPLIEKLCLLQALRWMITKTPPDARSHTMESFVDNDILGISSGKQELRHKVFACLLSPNPTYQKESMARLINAFASTWAGRNYLTSTDYVIDILIKSLSTFRSPTESFICHMVIATLQKLSLRKSMRKTMIEQKVIPWLVKYIKLELDREIIRDEVQQMASDWKGKDTNSTLNSEPADKSEGISSTSISSFYGDTFNKYLMEYAWALLMNLCLHDESMKSCMTVDFEFLHCIVSMLTNKSSFEFTPYVLSTLFSLLRNPEMFEKAKTMGLDKKLGPIVDQQSGEIATHLRHLLSQLYETGVDRLTASGETDYDDTDNPDPDEVESELELPESWMNNQSEALLTGDELLIHEYVIKKEMPFLPLPSPPGPDSVDDNKNLTDSSNSVDSPTSGLILRPITPTRNSTKSSRKEVNNGHRQPAPNSCPLEASGNLLNNRLSGTVDNNKEISALPNPQSTQQVRLCDGENKKQTLLQRNLLLHPEVTINTNPLLQQKRQTGQNMLPQLVAQTTPIGHTNRTINNTKETDNESPNYGVHEARTVTFADEHNPLLNLVPSQNPVSFYENDFDIQNTNVRGGMSEKDWEVIASNKPNSSLFNSDKSNRAAHFPNQFDHLS